MIKNRYVRSVVLEGKGKLSLQNFPYPDSFFLNGFNRIAGNSKLKQQLINGTGEKEIRKSWAKDLNEFKKVREKYLIYF